MLKNGNAGQNGFTFAKIQTVLAAKWNHLPGIGRLGDLNPLTEGRSNRSANWVGCALLYNLAMNGGRDDQRFADLPEEMQV